MTVPAELPLEPGRVYRIRDLSPWTADTTRLVRQLVHDGVLVALAHGLFVHPKPGRFGLVPPTDEELLRAFLGSAPFVLTGPERWNALELGTVTVFAHSLVYNPKRAGRFVLAGRPFVLRRLAFPSSAPPPEWFVVDLFEHAEQAGTSVSELARELSLAAAQGRFDSALLLAMASEFATHKIARTIRLALAGALHDDDPRRPRVR